MSCSPSKPPDYPEFVEKQHLVAVAQLARYDEKVAKEYTLITDRMNWLVVAESFIFTIFAAAIAAYDKAEERTQNILTVILIIMPILGAFISVLIIRAIEAAGSAIVKLKKGRKAFENRLPPDLRIDHISLEDPEHRLGNLPTTYAPAGIVLIWIILAGFTLYFRFSQ